MKNWPDAYIAIDGIPERWDCFCHNGLNFSGYCKENAENKRAAYYNTELPHSEFYLN